ncbi:hypothetical protein Pmani_037894 [Petrolisthes manimaculis]|uniref:Uncharacterized protein n=1 Tax=Petrolisthes manimaculis TaxID=1843537 RepID=A0AAE1NH96_9EUCA|nr:hypothetical protein Pmani_037894 [Petrolisthes manimaculis]
MSLLLSDNHNVVNETCAGNIVYLWLNLGSLADRRGVQDVQETNWLVLSSGLLYQDVWLVGAVLGFNAQKQVGECSCTRNLATINVHPSIYNSTSIIS